MGGGAYPDCNGVIQPEDYPECTLFGECGSGSPQELPGGGGWYFPPDDGTGREPCVRDAQRQCVTRELRPDEWDKLGTRIEALRENTEECLGAKNALRALYAQGRTSGRFRFWDGYDKTGPDEQRLGENVTDIHGRFIEFDSHWVWEDRTVLPHEGLHLYFSYNNHPTLIGRELHQHIYATDQTCV